MATQTITAVGQAETETNTPTATPTPTNSYPRQPLELKGALDSYQSFDVTPVIGREFVDVDLKEWLQAPNSDELLRDLAITSIF